MAHALTLTTTNLIPNMKHHLPIFVFLMLIVPSVAVGIHDYKATERSIEQDMQQALALTLSEKQSDVVTADTIRTFNSHLQWAELRGVATLSLTTQRDEQLQLQAECSPLTIWRLSDQRPSLALASMALVWAVGCGLRRRTVRSTTPVVIPKDSSVNSLETAPTVPSRAFGSLSFSESDGRFFNARHHEVRFTPMQQQLMELFFHASDYRLSKTAICTALWPKKDDASETLYTLIRRLKTVLEAETRLTIESDRSRSYQLTIRDLN